MHSRPSLPADSSVGKYIALRADLPTGNRYADAGLTHVSAPFNIEVAL